MNAEKFASVALSKVGEKEAPPHSNRGPFVEECQAACHARPGDPWCSCFVCWCVREANGGSYPEWFSPTPSGIALFHANDRLHVPFIQGVRFPQRGDIVVWSHGHGLSHVAIVTETDWLLTPGRSLQDHRMHTVAGNTTNGRNYCDPAEDRKASREGDQVGCNIYPIDDSRILGYLRPEWSVL